MKISEATENYLETILILQTRMGQVRAIDLANDMGYAKPTISIALKQYREAGLVETDAEGYLHLTSAGREIADGMYERHQVLAQFLMGLGVSEKNAYADACKIEHDISAETFQCIRRAMDNPKP